MSVDMAVLIGTLIERNEQYKADIFQFLNLLEETRQNWKVAAMKANSLREENLELKKALGHVNKNIRMTKKDRTRVADFTCSDLDEVDYTIDKEEADVSFTVKCEAQTLDNQNFTQSFPNAKPTLTLSSGSNQSSSAEECFEHPASSNDPRFEVAKKIRRSNSVPDYLELDVRPMKIACKARVTVERTASLNVTSKSQSGDINDFFDADDDGLLIDERNHELQQRRNFTNANCSVCRKSINFGIISVRCMICRLSFHQDCSRRNIMPCMPRRAPKKQQKQAKLGDYCPDIRPMIPQIVGFCCIQVERSATTLPVYQNTGCQQEVQRLFSAFMKKDKVPNLVDYGVLTISETLKRFLSSLKQPLVPLGYHAEFKGAAQMVGGEKELIQQISALPQAHCDTLAYFCRHLKRLNENCDHENLSLTNLSEALAPVIFRTSESLILSNKEAAVITNRLIQLPSEDLQQLLGNDNKLNRVPSDHLKRRRRSFQGDSPLPPLASVTTRRR